MKKSLILGLALLSQALPAMEGCFECDTRFCLEAEYLLLKPAIHDPYYVIREGGSNQPFGIRQGNLWSWGSGVRLLGAYNFCGNAVSARMEGLWIGDSHTDRARFTPLSGLGTKGNVLADINTVDNARSRLLYDLYNVKGGVQYCFMQRCRFSASANLSLHYANLIVDERIDYDEFLNFVNVQHRGKTWGLGPEMGLGISYQLCGGLHFVAQAGCGLLAGESRASTRTLDLPDPGQTFDPEDVLAINQANNLVAPFADMRLGFRFAKRCRCFSPSVAVGYEFLRYGDFYDAVRWCGEINSEPNTGAEGISFDHYGPFMAHGLTISVGICW